MAEISDYLENIIINHVFRNQAYTPAGTVYVALYTDDPTDADTGSEVSGGAYARQDAVLAAASGGASSNDATITFPSATADWGTVTHVGIRDSVTTGNLLMHSALDAQKVVNDGDTFKINKGDLDISFV